MSKLIVTDRRLEVPFGNPAGHNNKMLFFLRKLIEALLLPIGISCLFTLAGIAFRRRWAAAIGVITLCTFSTPAVSTRLMASLEQSYPLMSVADAPHADAIVVLSGSVVRGISAPGVQWGDSANRYFAGFDLAMAGKADTIVFSAAVADSVLGLSQGAILRRVAIAHGLPASRIVVTGRVFTTEDEARAVSQIPGIHSILLVTSAFHMPRAALLFRARGLRVFPFPTDLRSFAQQPLQPASFVPGAAALRNSEEAVREYYGLAVYRTLYFRSTAALQKQ
ncbi:MAG TPA: YdcF family protein [Bryobacteraceae bacterium]|nr:YdcF family protein [Bryobacteraceae bacterium]